MTKLKYEIVPCFHCGKQMPYKSLTKSQKVALYQRNRVYCSKECSRQYIKSLTPHPQEVSCTQCSKNLFWDDLVKWQKDNYKSTGRAYCSVKCSKEYRRRVSSTTMAQTNKKYASERMTNNNPMKSPDVRQKVSNSLKAIGHKPPMRKGNGTGMTVPQKILFDALCDFNPIAEYGEYIGEIRGLYPFCYKIDIAIPKCKIAIEVDGNSHKLLSRREEDIKKTEALQSKGWKVLRFWNEEILANLNNCLEKINCEVENVRISGNQTIA